MIMYGGLHRARAGTGLRAVSSGGAAGRGLSGVFRRLCLSMRRRADGGRASAAIPGTGGRAGAPARSARAAAVAILLAFTALVTLPSQAEAQAEIMLVSNTGETVDSGRNDNFQAQSFGTGSNTGGYTITEVLGGSAVQIPWAGWSLTGSGGQTVRLGWRLRFGPGGGSSGGFGIEASRAVRRGTAPDHRIGFALSVSLGGGAASSGRPGAARTPPGQAPEEWRYHRQGQAETGSAANDNDRPAETRAAAGR